MQTENRLKLTKPELQAVFLSLGTTPAERFLKLKTILNDFYQALSTDLLVGFYFDNKDLKHIAQQQYRFLLKAFGEVDSELGVYQGPSPAKSHEKLAPILSGHFDRRLRVLEQILRQYQLSTKQIQTWIQFEESFRDGIVTS